MSVQPAVFTLANGARLVCRKLPGKVDYFGVLINAGSRDDPEGFDGLAHFVEHTIFKGTENRRACHIINRMESIGGELNAFTTKEETNVYTVFPHGNLMRAAELVADLIRNSVFPEKELAKEREVVRDEIDSYLDTPSEAVFDDFEALFFRGSRMSHNILGNADNLDRFTSDVCREYIRTLYVASRMVIFYQGSAFPERVLGVVERYFTDIPSGDAEHINRIAPARVAPFSERRDIGSHQAHCVMGAPMPAVGSPDRVAINLLSNILGGAGMNSRLNVALRERRGLVYAVDSSANMMSDCGLFTIYFGCDPQDSGRCMELVNEELHKISTVGLTARQLTAVRRQFLGQLVVAADNRENTALNLARTLLLFGEMPAPDAERKAVEALTSDRLLQAAAWLSPEKFSSLTLG